MNIGCIVGSTFSSFIHIHTPSWGFPGLLWNSSAFLASCALNYSFLYLHLSKTILSFFTFHDQKKKTLLYTTTPTLNSIKSNLCLCWKFLFSFWQKIKIPHLFNSNVLDKNLHNIWLTLLVTALSQAFPVTNLAK